MRPEVEGVGSSAFSVSLKRSAELLLGLLELREVLQTASLQGFSGCCQKAARYPYCNHSQNTFQSGKSEQAALDEFSNRRFLTATFMCDYRMSLSPYGLNKLYTR